MSTGVTRRTRGRSTPDTTGPAGGARHPALAAMAAVLGFALATNAVLGPLMAGVIQYRYGTSMINQAIGLDAVALLIGGPLALVAGWLTHRGHAAGPVLALAPATFAAYMMPQYVIGPDYPNRPGNNEDFAVAHIAVFVLAVAVIVAAWRGIDRSRLRPATVVSDHRRSWILFGLAAFIALGRQLPAIVQIARDPTANLAYQDNPTAFWLVAFLDLAIVTPAAIAAGIGLRRGAAWARTAAYTVMGWFALVPLSVAAMNLAMRMNDDPLATTADAVVVSIAAVVFTAAAAALYRPLFVSTRSTG
jgi:hypothetical protein